MLRFPRGSPTGRFLGCPLAWSSAFHFPIPCFGSGSSSSPVSPDAVSLPSPPVSSCLTPVACTLELLSLPSVPLNCSHCIYCVLFPWCIVGLSQCYLKFTDSVFANGRCTGDPICFFKSVIHTFISKFLMQIFHTPWCCLISAYFKFLMLYIFLVTTPPSVLNFLLFSLVSFLDVFWNVCLCFSSYVGSLDYNLCSFPIAVITNQLML